MYRTAAFAAALVVALNVVPVFAAEHEDSVKVETEVKKSDEKKNEIPPEKAVTTNHSVSVGGKSIAYKATAGTLIIRDDKGKPDASVFYVAYTADGESGKRPVTFLYNGGPGSASIWLHMGSFGPVRVVTQSPEATGPAPFHLVPNDDSLLDKTDLVFVDAIGTGFSKGLPKGKDENGKPDKDDDNPNKRFWGTDQDIDAFGRFIIRYITVNKRWNSPNSCSANRTARRARLVWRAISKNMALRSTAWCCCRRSSTTRRVCRVWTTTTSICCRRSPRSRGITTNCRTSRRHSSRF